MSSPNHLHRATAIDRLALTHLLTPNSLLDNAISASSAAGLPAITISPLQGQFLALQCRLMAAKSVLEIGTLGGYSTIWFASTGAAVTSIEINPKHQNVALQNTKACKGVEIILGAALDVLPRLKDEGRSFDFVFIDAAWEEQFEYFQWAAKLTRKGGCVYVDNVVRELLESEAIEEGESLVTQVGKMAGVQATLVSTISGHKGKSDEMMDGFLLAVVD